MIKARTRCAAHGVFGIVVLALAVDTATALGFSWLCFALATIAACSLHRAGTIALAIRDERRARPRLPPGMEEAITRALITDCCETWWTSAGASHSTTCTRRQEYRP